MRRCSARSALINVGYMKEGGRGGWWEGVCRKRGEEKKGKRFVLADGMGSRERSRLALSAIESVAAS